MVSENGLKEPPPPAIATLAVPVTLQVGIGLGDGLALGEGLGEGLGLGVWARAWVAPMLRKITPSVAAAPRIQNGRFGSGERPDFVVWSLSKMVLIIFSLFVPAGT
jgi:hypothetical protein